MANRKKSQPRSKKPPLPPILQGPMYEEATRSVPPDVWCACVQIYQAAAKFRMPTKNPAEYKLRIEGTLYGFTDTKMNRGAFAIKEFLRTGQSELFPAIMSRVMAFLAQIEAVRSMSSFAKFFKDEDNESYMISEALIKAFAIAEFVQGTFDINLDSLQRIADANLAADPD